MMLGDDQSDALIYRGVANPQKQALAGSTLSDAYFSRQWAEDPDDSAGFDIARYWRVVLKHRWILLGSVVAAVIAGLAITLIMTPIYHAEATVKIDREAAQVVNIEKVEPNENSGTNEEFFQTQYGLLKSRNLAINVVDQLGLATGNTFFKAMGFDPAKSKAPLSQADRRRIAADIFQDNLSISPVRGSRLVKVGFDSPDPVLAARIANTTTEQFIESNLQRRYESSDYARTFLEKKLKETKAKLEQSEKAAQDYATRESLINVAPVTNDNTPGPSSNQSLATTSLVALNAALSTATGERIRAEQRWRQSQSAAAASLPEVLQNPTIQELNQARAKLQAEYQEMSSRYKPDYPDLVNLRERVTELDQQIQRQMANIQNSLKVAYDVSLSQERSFETQVRRLQGAALDVGERSIQYGILLREADTDRTIYEGLLKRFNEVGVTGAIATNNISVVDTAETPIKASKPKPLVNLGIAGLAGLALGMMIVFLIEILDESITSPEDIESKLGLSVLGSVPKLIGDLSLEEVSNDERSAFSEAYYSIRSALQFSTNEGAPSSLLITSSRPSEGKSTTTMAIAKSFARIGERVLMVDGDMRNPSVHRSLQLENSKGLSNILTGAMGIAEAIHPSIVTNLDIITCGPLPPNPAELLAGNWLRSFIEEALKTYTMVVIDGPPVLGLADAPTLAAAVSGTVFVIESRGTRRAMAKTAIRRLQLGNARILGAILTKFDAKKSAYGYGSGYAYAYSYEYGSKPKISSR